MEAVLTEEFLENQRAFYATFWRGYNQQMNRMEIERLAEIWRGISLFVDRIKPDWQICDLGCGTGWLSMELQRMGQVTAVDLSPDGIDLARTRWKGPNFECQNILSWRPKKQFDLVVSTEVMEHIEDKVAFFETINSIVRPGGYVILTTPNGRLKKWWDRAGAGKQIIEAWSDPTEVRSLLSGYEILRHETFVFDYLYIGPYRLTSAPTLLSFLRTTKLLHLYDGLRKTLGVGLYQIIVAKKR